MLILEAQCMNSCTGGVPWPGLHPLTIWDPLGDIRELVSAQSCRPGQGTPLVHEFVYWASSLLIRGPHFHVTGLTCVHMCSWSWVKSTSWWNMCQPRQTGTGMTSGRETMPWHLYFGERTPVGNGRPGQNKRAMLTVQGEVLRACPAQCVCSWTREYRPRDAQEKAWTGLGQVEAEKQEEIYCFNQVTLPCVNY